MKMLYSVIRVAVFFGQVHSSALGFSPFYLTIQSSLKFLSNSEAKNVIFLRELWVVRVFASLEGVTPAPGTIGCVEGNH